MSFQIYSRYRFNWEEFLKTGRIPDIDNIDNLNIPLVLTYETEVNNINSQNFINSLNKNKWEYISFGNNNVWKGFDDRLKKYHNMLLHLPKNKIVILKTFGFFSTIFRVKP